MTRRMPVALAALVLVGCSAVLAPSPPGEPADPEADMRPDLIVAEPAQVAPGAVLSLTFPEETDRGIHFVLERQAGGAWFHMYDLTSDGPGEGWEPRSRPAGAGDFAVEDIGVGGPGPDHVVIPDGAQPGTWRICTGNAGSNFCTTIEIVEG